MDLYTEKSGSAARRGGSLMYKVGLGVDASRKVDLYD